MPPEVAVIGAGPFGLSVAAHLGARARVFGAPLDTWRTRMPPEMLLRSAWDETSLSAPGARGSIDEWAREAGEPRQEPLPLDTFLRYGDWFRERFVADHAPAPVKRVEPAGRGVRVTTADGSLDVAAAVVAVGALPFVHAPAALADAVGEGVGFALEPEAPSALAGRRVLVVGAGQAGLESAGLAARAGATVEVVTRSEVRWFADREPHHPRGPLRQRLYRLAYPAVGYGPPPLNRLALHPDAFARLPRRARRLLTARLLRPGGSPWVHELVAGRVRLTEGVAPVGIEPGDPLRVSLSDGTAREVDRVLLATGYRFDARRLGFLDEALRRSVRLEQDGWPVLDRWFRSTEPRLSFVGYAAEGRFGPSARFVLGARFAAERVASSLGGQRGRRTRR
jgi:NADPH-dependent 2,4-dienoyl-CoA reductase/sulfur reductase-like enzyme